jgi:hypothetical protein
MSTLTFASPGVLTRLPLGWVHTSRIVSILQFPHPLMTTLIFNGIIINLLLLYRLPYFVFGLLVIFVPFYVLGLNL